ncbi:hypothetical protein NPIL_224051 [Nephila pilipes]|uniref:Uncharacterized protein n=1 Tax=Nephila pilipes TaxID=299642 RepID=A0A8X6UAL0_NEPPI|nr:hypothetical protein NPIL_224051 [Nephila pilipes]
MSGDGGIFCSTVGFTWLRYDRCPYSLSLILNKFFQGLIISSLLLTTLKTSSFTILRNYEGYHNWFFIHGCYRYDVWTPRKLLPFNSLLVHVLDIAESYYYIGGGGNFFYQQGLINIICNTSSVVHLLGRIWKD